MNLCAHAIARSRNTFIISTTLCTPLRSLPRSRHCFARPVAPPNQKSWLRAFYSTTNTMSTLTSLNRVSSQSIQDTNFPDHASERKKPKLCYEQDFKKFRTFGDVLNYVTSYVFFTRFSRK